MKLQKQVALLLAVLMVAVLLPLSAIAATVLPGEVTFTKGLVASESDPANNVYAIKLTANGEPVSSTSSPDCSVVLVIDVSGSMKGGRITTAKNAAKEFVKTLLEINPRNQVAIVTYASKPNTVQGFTSDKATLDRKIDSLAANGGTHMMGGLHLAQQLVAGKQNAHVVLLADGEPTYGYQPKISLEVTKCSLIHSTDLVASKTEFDYTKNCGSGSDTSEGETEWVISTTCPECGRKVVRILKSTEYDLADGVKYEAGLVKNSAKLYTIGFETSGYGTALLDSIDNGGYYNGTISNLTQVFKDMATTIAKPAGTNAVVTDVMSQYVDPKSVQVPSGVTYSDGTLTWNIGTLTSEGASITYKVSLKEEYLKPEVETDYPLNASATLNYTDFNGRPASKSAPSPKVAVEAAPTETPAPPTDTPAPPSWTPEPPTETPAPPSWTPEPPTETPDVTPAPPTETPAPPTETPAPPTWSPEPPEETPAPPSWTPEVTEVPPQVFDPTPTPIPEVVPTPEEIVEEEPPLVEPDDGEIEEIGEEEIPTTVPKTGDGMNSFALVMALIFAGMLSAVVILRRVVTRSGK